MLRFHHVDLSGRFFIPSTCLSSSLPSFSDSSKAVFSAVRTLVDLASPCSGSRLDLLDMDHPIGLVEAANNQDLLAHVFLRRLLIIELVSNVVCASSQILTGGF